MTNCQRGERTRGDRSRDPEKLPVSGAEFTGEGPAGRDRGETPLRSSLRHPPGSDTPTS
jgi:hypothetical protein